MVQRQETMQEPEQQQSSKECKLLRERSGLLNPMLGYLTNYGHTGYASDAYCISLDALIDGFRKELETAGCDKYDTQIVNGEMDKAEEVMGGKCSRSFKMKYLTAKQQKKMPFK